MISVFSRSSRLAAVAALPLLLAAKPVAAPLAGGTTYEFIIRSQNARTGDKESVMMHGRGTFAGENGRIDILETSTPGQTFGSKGSYFIVQEGGRKMILVDPANKQYMQWDMASMLAGLSKVMNAMGGLVKMEMSDVKIDAQSLGAGETIEGYKTVHYRMVENYTVTTKVFGRGSTNRSETTTDYYFAPSLKGLSNPFMASGKQMAQSFDMFNNPAYKTQMAAAMAKIQFGVPVRAVTHTVSTDDKGKQTTSVVTSEMVNFRNIDVPHSTFAIPEGFKEIQMPNLNAGLAGTGNSAGSAPSTEVNADSIAKAAKDSAKDAVKDAAKDQAKNAAAKKLKGIFKH